MRIFRRAAAGWLLFLVLALAGCGQGGSGGPPGPGSPGSPGPNASELQRLVAALGTGAEQLFPLIAGWPDAAHADRSGIE